MTFEPLVGFYIAVGLTVLFLLLIALPTLLEKPKSKRKKQ